MPVSTHFFAIHLVAFIALLINIGPQQDGWDNLTKRFTLNGKIATAIIGLDLVALIHFLLTAKVGLAAYGSFYLGYGITAIAFIIPFTAISHYASSPKFVKINMVGWIAIALGASGFVSSLFLVFFSKAKVATNMSEDYVAILGHFITVASAMIALTEGLNAGAAQPVQPKAAEDEHARRKAEDKLFERRDLKRVAIKVIMIGFVVSAVNSIIQNRKEDEVKNNLLSTKTFITDSLDTHITKLDAQIKNTEKDLGKVNKQLQGLLTTVKTLGQISESLEALDKKVAQKDEVNTLLKKSDELSENDNAQKKALEKLNQDLSAELDKYNGLTQKLTQNSETRQKSIDAIKANLDQYKRQLDALQKTASDKTELKQLQTIVRGQQNILDKIQQKMLTQASLAQLSQNVVAMQTRLKSFETRIQQQISKIPRPLKQTPPAAKDTVK
ncbi:hypothetical protein BKI52_19575 [marine bacterium AO1-C]|nr:hypothetical protein BKI52_19575 [marine bacterium AO1-C]